jgi:hypothetical protein
MKRLYESNGSAQVQKSSQQLFSCYQHLSESDILDLQDIFLTNGIHRVMSYDLFTGRTLVDIFLHAMAPNYHEKACLTVHSYALDPVVLDLYSMMYMFAGDDPIEYLEEFFTQQLYVDFMWIEETPQLRALPWYGTFLETLSSLHLDAHIPIVIFSYETEGR